MNIVFDGRFEFNAIVIAGRKSGKGFYVYEPGVKERPINEKCLDILKKYKLQAKVKRDLKLKKFSPLLNDYFPQGPISDEDIQLRLASRFINEAAYCLQEGILDNPVSKKSSFFT